jgi:predicted RNA-binding protein Jag
MKETVEQIAREFFDKLSVEIKSLKISEEVPWIFRVKIESGDSHILIGPHGKHLEVLSSILRLMMWKSLWEHINLHLEVNDYLEKKDEKLFLYIKSKMQLVEKSGQEFRLPYFSAYERKKVHSFVSEQTGKIYTKSEGEGEERRIFLCKKDEKMTIDIDGDTI